MAFSQAVVQAAAREREVGLTTFGRKTGRPTRVTIWVSSDGSRLFIRSGRGLGRQWPQNLLARGRAVLHLSQLEVPVQARHVSDPAEARTASEAVARKYGPSVRRSLEGEALTPAETATFELTPA